MNQWLDSLAGCSRNAEELTTLFLHKVFEIFNLFFGRDIALICNNNLFSGRKLLAEVCKLMIDSLEIFFWISSFTAGNIHNMNNQAAALNMAQKFMAQTNTIACAFNQSRNICHNKGFFLCYFYNAQNWSQGGEVIVCNNRFCSADNRNQGRFANIWIAYQTNVCQKFKFQN